ncbi:MAG: mercuric reductase [Sphingomonas sp. SCN 67-18]|uniref:mercuric transporter MerT family protein n=1 Tax=uncultured Sphingomonas sp. TaxID=158754 RepID=UPI00086A442C|nr:mercuric transporter MerT family protein [Sphingomonas sp. SCN 67-18]ODU20414.1 MAG: mercuric reductase [Sphingomonas sp. SCN 67-18]
MSQLSPKAGGAKRARGAALLTLGGIATAFGVAACCGLPIVLTGLGIGAAWLGGIAAVTGPYRDPLMLLSALSLAGGAFMLWRMRRTASACDDRICAPRWLTMSLFIGLVTGVSMLWMGYSYA